jgi:preprotein translocase subunit SecD
MSATVRLLALWFTSLTLLAATPRQPAVFEIRKVLDGPSEDSEHVVLLHRAKDNGQEVKEVLNVTKMPGLDQSAVKAARVVADEISGKPQVEVRLNEEGKKRFAEVTRANVDKRLAILVEGKVVMAPIVRTEIKDGRALIAGDFTQEEAKALALAGMDPAVLTRTDPLG